MIKNSCTCFFGVLFLLFSFSGYAFGGSQSSASSGDVNALSFNPVSGVLTQSPLLTSKGFAVELFNYQEYLYSQSKGSEVGDKVEISTRLRYQFNSSAWGSVGFTTVPEQNRFDNKTSELELRGGYAYGDFIAQADFGIELNDTNDGGISFGPDLDSEGTFITYKMSPTFALTLYPFNFDSAVGVEYNTGDVSRIYFVEGSPSAIGSGALASSGAGSTIRLIQKTLPGIEIKAKLTSKLSTYAGVSFSNYLYPKDTDFDIRESSVALSGGWERKETYGLKFGGFYKGSSSLLSLQAVGHGNSRQTGSLLTAALSSYGLFELPRGFVAEVEGTFSKAGSYPYRVNRSGEDFDPDLTGNSSFSSDQRVYSDLNGEVQDWVNEIGGAAAVKLGYQFAKWTPFLSYKYQSENFVYEARESAHRLRTNDRTLSHGGLNRIGLGAFIYSGQFLVNPSFEYRVANQAVFGNRDDVRRTDISTEFKKQDFAAFINVNYFFRKPTGVGAFRILQEDI